MPDAGRYRLCRLLPASRRSRSAQQSIRYREQLRLRSKLLTSWNNLTTYCKVQLSSCSQVSANQSEISPLSGSIIVLCVKKIEHRRSALLVRKTDRVTHLK